MSSKILPLVVLLIVVLGIVGLYIYKTPRAQLSVSPILTPSAETTSTPINPNCTKDQLYGTMSPQAGAGNVFADIKITNISKMPCNITLGNSIAAQISANNISTKYQTATAGSEEFSLNPNASVYSRLHYPNGPQCNGPVNPQNVSFVYDPKGISLQLKTDDGKNYLTLQACVSSDNTQIDIWPVSQQSID